MKGRCKKKMKTTKKVVCYPSLPVVVNIVCAGDVRHNIDLDALSAGCNFPCQYDPCVFPGVRIVLPECKVSVFRTGAVVLTGLKEDDDRSGIWHTICDEVKPFSTDSS